MVLEAADEQLLLPSYATFLPSPPATLTRESVGELQLTKMAMETFERPSPSGPSLTIDEALST